MLDPARLELRPRSRHSTPSSVNDNILLAPDGAALHTEFCINF